MELREFSDICDSKGLWNVGNLDLDKARLNRIRRINYSTRGQIGRCI